MTLRQFSVSGRSLSIAAVLIGMVSLAIGAPAALNKRSLDTAKAADARIAVIDASRRNPYERRFRGFSHGLAPINAPDNTLILSSATPGKVAEDSQGANSLLVTELLNNIGSKAAGAEALFTQTRIAVSRASNGEQVPSVSSSLLQDVHLAAE